MRTEVIEADTIDKAVQRILQELKEDDDAAAAGGGGGTASRSTTSSSRHNVIYFDGWDGLGASAVLREVGRRLTTGLDFSRIIHIDCSKWESRRAMQRALAEQLQLPPPVMGMFDMQDEEDNYNGVDQGSRLEIPKVAREIYQHVQKQLSRRFLVIFNNGGCEEINLESSGFPLSGYSRNCNCRKATSTS
ncbi:hypothetical protein C2845_PM17G03370 [Panicum miliaceum]|uniref:Uncharacterized protein n=1 Tax=Panicum miliaceum TaxID=4540 RepID=A0A3L6Q3P8_PANMI|nr:hypothetical protein C2845_PM17G03370 [Panicum miliaceum]